MNRVILAAAAASVDKTFSVEEPLGGGTPLLDEERQGQSRENFPIPPLLSLFFFHSSLPIPYFHPATPHPPPFSLLSIL